MFKRLLLLTLFIFIVTSIGQTQPKVDTRPKDLYRPTAVPAHAIEMASADEVPIENRPFTRYFWNRSGQVEDIKALASALNYISRASTIVRPTVVNNYIIRVDLRQLAPRADDLVDYIKFWEDLRFDPDVSLLITKGTINQLIEQAKVNEEIATTFKGQTIKVRVSKTDKVKVKCEPYTWDGQTWDWKWQRVKVDTIEKRTLTLTRDDLKDVDVIRLNPLSIDPKLYEAFQLALVTEAPIISVRYFIRRALSTIKDKGVFATIYGGRYYEFAGIKKSNDKKKQTDEDLLFEQLGITAGNNGKNAKEIFDKLRSDQRVAIFRSNVTGKPRRADFLKTLVTREGESFVSITHDLKDQSIDIDQHPILNLVDYKDDARELIYTRSNGYHGFALFDGDGNLIDEAAVEVVVDRTIPAPYSPRLEAAISCIRCHGPFDGWQPIANDVKKLLSSYVDNFGDVTNRNDIIPDTLDRLAGLYAGSPDKLLTRGRDDFAEAVLRATGPWKQSKDQVDTVKLASAQIGTIWHDYNYVMIDAKLALYELGFDVDKDNVLPFIKALLPPVLSNKVNGIYPEDPRIAALIAGIPINRNDWNLIQSFASFRALKSINDVEKKLKEQQKKAG